MGEGLLGISAGACGPRRGKLQRMSQSGDLLPEIPPIHDTSVQEDAVCI